jgi:RimJ/RimL family protein N-acetyltransferase
MAMMETARVVLSAIEPHDIPAIVRWRNLPDVYRGFIEYEPLSTTQQAAFLASLTPASTRRLWLINARTGTNAGDLVPIGTVGIMDLDWRNRRCEFGPIFIGELDYRGKGLAKDAEVLVLDYCFNHLGLHKVIAHVTESNAEVLPFHEACGFTHGVMLRDHIFRQGRFEGLHQLSCLADECRERFPTGQPAE